MDELPKGVDDIRGYVHNEPERIFWVSTPHEANYPGEITGYYIGLDEVKCKAP